MTWINREAEQELRRIVEEEADEWETSDLPYLSGERAEELKDRIRYLRNIARTMFLDMHVIDAGDDEAEKALERAVGYGYFGYPEATNDQELAAAKLADAAIVRARLRAARASHTPHPASALCPGCGHYEAIPAASHTPEEIEAAHWGLSFLVGELRKVANHVLNALDASELHAEVSKASAALSVFLPPRPEPAAKPESIIAEASGTHVLERTSRKGHPFVGRCSGCGVEGPASLAREKCPAAKPKETQE